jgi:non-specific serine/threonine protein kinase
MYMGDYARAEDHYTAALAVFGEFASEQPAERARVADVLAEMGLVALRRGDYERALARLEEALVAARALGYTWLTGLILNNLGCCAGQMGDAGRAVSWYREAVAIMAAQRDRRVLALAIQGLAGTAVTRGRHAEAARLLGAAAGLFERIGLATESTVPLRDHEMVLAREAITQAREAIGEVPFSTAWAEGRALTLQEAVQEADALAATLLTATPSPSPEHDPAADALSPREREVLRLVARGQTDAEIAAALFLSKRTISTHLTNVFGKLGLTNRTEAAAWAVRHGLA